MPINKVRAILRTNPITVSQPHVITKKHVNSDSNGLSSTGVDNTAKTRRPPPRSNTNNDRVPSAVYNQRKKIIMETMNATFDELLAMAFEQCSLKPRLQSMNSEQISSGLDLTYASSTIATQKLTKYTVPTPTNSSSQATNIPNTSHDVDKLEPKQQHVQQQVQQQENQALLQPKIVADNVPNATFDGDVFENPFAPPSTSVVES
nr:hypothetical protein [Tanacetum cinerariifolium]